MWGRPVCRRIFLACAPVINPLVLVTSTSAWNCRRKFARIAGVISPSGVFTEPDGFAIGLKKRKFLAIENEKFLFKYPEDCGDTIGGEDAENKMR